AVIPPPDMRRALEELLPTLPPQLGGGPTATLTRGVRWASLAVRPPPEPSLRLVIGSQDARAAADLLGVIDAALKLGADSGLAPGVTSALRPKVEGDRVVL